MRLFVIIIGLVLPYSSHGQDSELPAYVFSEKPGLIPFAPESRIESVREAESEGGWSGKFEYSEVVPTNSPSSGQSENPVVIPPTEVQRLWLDYIVDMRRVPVDSEGYFIYGDCESISVDKSGWIQNYHKNLNVAYVLGSCKDAKYDRGTLTFFNLLETDKTGKPVSLISGFGGDNFQRRPSVKLRSITDIDGDDLVEFIIYVRSDNSEATFGYALDPLPLDKASKVEVDFKPEGWN